MRALVSSSSIQSRLLPVAFGRSPALDLLCSRASGVSSWGAFRTFCTTGQMTQAPLSSRACTLHVARNTEYGARAANTPVQIDGLRLRLTG